MLISFLFTGGNKKKSQETTKGWGGAGGYKIFDSAAISIPEQKHLIDPSVRCWQP